jgi:integrase
LLSVNIDSPSSVVKVPTLGAIVSRYELEEMPERYSTQSAYRSHLKNHIKPRWSDTPVPLVKAMAVEHWLKSLTLAPKTKAHIRRYA